MDNLIIGIILIIALDAPILLFLYTKSGEDYDISYKKRLEAGLEKGNFKDIDISLLESIYHLYFKAKKQAPIMLAWALTSLFLGAISFYYASVLVTKDQRAYEKTAKDALHLSIQQRYYDSAAKYLNINYDSLLQKKMLKDTSIVGRKADILYSQIAELTRLKYPDQISKEVHERFKNENNNDNTPGNSNSFYFIFSTISTRIIISLLTFYLAQLFIRLYNYYLRVSDFYINRFDAIIAYRENDFKMNFQETTSIFEHKTEIGIGPRNPIKTAIKIIEAIKNK